MVVAVDQKKIKPILEKIDQAFFYLRSYEYPVFAVDHEDGEPYLEYDTFSSDQEFEIVFYLLALKRLSDCYRHSPDIIFSNSSKSNLNNKEFMSQVEKTPELYKIYENVKNVNPNFVI